MLEPWKLCLCNSFADFQDRYESVDEVFTREGKDEACAFTYIIVIDQEHEPRQFYIGFSLFNEGWEDYCGSSGEIDRMRRRLNWNDAWIHRFIVSWFIDPFDACRWETELMLEVDAGGNPDFLNKRNFTPMPQHGEEVCSDRSRIKYEFYQHPENRKMTAEATKEGMECKSVRWKLFSLSRYANMGLWPTVKENPFRNGTNRWRLFNIILENPGIVYQEFAWRRGVQSKHTEIKDFVAKDAIRFTELNSDEITKWKASTG